ncbi:MAG: hypothetical protein FRX49_01460 [Trebouxia sp. A1-2]|nr:MAG: hypothetical protein FRX49_01460 [Trebouxia sp. A1-2]
MGLPPELDGHKRENATTHIAARRMHMHTATGLMEHPAAPVLVDTPGFFDTDKTLKDVALKQSGTMAVYLIMVDGKKIARLDQHIHDQIVNLVSHEKPVLVCLNQMSRYKDYCGPAEETKKQLQAVKDLVIKDADGACGPLEVCATEFIDYDEHLREINVKGLEYELIVYGKDVPCPVRIDMAPATAYPNSSNSEERPLQAALCVWKGVNSSVRHSFCLEVATVATSAAPEDLILNVRLREESWLASPHLT